MKVRVEFTVDVDPILWDMNYGTGTEPPLVRDDVRTYVENGAREHLDDMGVLVVPPFNGYGKGDR